MLRHVPSGPMSSPPRRVTLNGITKSGKQQRPVRDWHS